MGSFKMSKSRSKKLNKKQSSKDEICNSNKSKDVKIVERMGLLYFTSDADRSRGLPIEVKHECIPKFSAGVEGTEDEILCAWLLTEEISPLIPGWLRVSHDIAVVQSRQFFWSYEKDLGGICVQRSKTLRSVLQYYRGIKRQGIGAMDKRYSQEAKQGNKIQSVFDWIYNQKCLRLNNSSMTVSSCQYFASELVDAVVGKGLSQLS